MKISVKQTKKGVFSLTLGDAVVTLDKGQIKTLLLEAVGALAPGAMPAIDPKVAAGKLVAKLKGANPAGIQQLILAASDDDVLIFLKSNEGDSAFIDMMFANMSERTQSMFREDLEFRFKEGVPDDSLIDATDHLEQVSAKLEADGLLEYS